MKNRKKLITTILVSVGVLCLAIGAIVALSLGGVFQKDQVDVAWYEEEGKEFLITTAEELRGIAKLSQKHDFKGQTIKLGADIVLNEGDYTQWKKDFLNSVWNPIEGFAGTFDGQGHTISGLYCVANGFSVFGKDVLWNPAGMFIDSTDDAVIRDFRIVNSYYTSSNKGGLGSVIGRGNGTIESVYSSATLVASASVNGGLVGEVKEGGSLTMKNCQFDGEMLLRGQNTVYTGGMIGYVKSTKGLVTIEHCLFSGEMITEQTSGTLDVGGFIGFTIAKSRVEMKDCLSSGKIDTAHKRNVGSLIGSHTGAIMKMDNVYADIACMDATIGLASTAVSSYPLEFVSECFVGENALKWIELDFKKYWTIVEDGAPTLRTFADKVVEAKELPKAYNTDWFDAKRDTYTISTLDEWYGFYVLSAENAFKGKTIKLDADIKVNEGIVADWKKEAPSVPYYPIKKFDGTFDGDGHTISGVYLKTAQRNSGLFTETGSAAKLTNFKLINSYFESAGDGIALIGSVVGMLDGEMNTVYSDAVVAADALIFGGLAGNVISTSRATITNCWYDGEMIVGDGGGYVGGITGQVENGSHARIMHCLNSGNITATKEKGSMTMGGIVGVISDERTKVAITDCLNVGTVSTPANAGIGSIVSTILPKTTVTLENCYATEESCRSSVASKHGKLEGGTYRKQARDLSGYQAYELTMLDFDKYWAVVKNGTPILQSFATDVPSLAGHEKKINTKWYKLKEDTYTLNTVADLYGFYHMSYNTDFKGKTIKLGKNITVNKGNAENWQKSAPALTWYSIYNFAGTFDGQGRTISGIYMKTDLQGRGLFGSTMPTTVIKNLKLTNSYFEGTHKTAAQMGSVVGKVQGRVEGVYSDAIIVADTLITGGIAGDISSKEKVVISNCWFDGTMKIGNKGGYVGGIVGEAQDGTIAEISHCLNTGNIIGTKEKGSLTMGGIIGIVADDNTKVTVSDTLNVGKVSTPSNSGIGAICSTILPKTTLVFDNCYATLESCPGSYASKHGTVEGACYRRTEADLAGYMAYEWTLLNFDKYWAVVDGDTPILKKFASKIPSVAGYERKINIDWYKKNAKEYVLKTAEDLYGFYYMTYETDFTGKTVKLGADITVNKGNAADWKSNAPSSPWYSIRKFAGTFDGQGHTISGIYMKTDIQGSGLFGETTPKTVIKNFKLTNSYFESICKKPAMIGSIAGKGQGTFDTIYSDAIVVANTVITGGLIGDISSKEKVTVTNCWFDGTMDLGKNSGYAGGIAGEVQDGTNAEFSHCLNTGTIKGAGEAMTMAGIVGVLADEGTNVTVTDTLAAGLVTCKNGAIGAIASTVLPDTVLNIEKCYATKEGAPKIVHKVHGTQKGRCYALGEGSISGQGGYRWTDLNFKNYWTVSDATPVLKSFAPEVAEKGNKVDIGWYDEQQTEFVINSLEELYGLYYLSYDTDFSGKNIKLGKDIDFTGYEWTPIQKFAGTFDGQMHILKNFAMKMQGVDNVAFINQTTEETVIKNLQFTNVEISGKKTVATVAATAQGTFQNINVTGNINGTGTQVAGLFGAVITSAENTTLIENCQFIGSVKSTSVSGYVGGFVGYLRNSSEAENVIIRNCNVTGNIESAGPYVGGFAGYVDKKNPIHIEDSISCITTKATAYAGGSVGMNAGDTAATTATVLDNVFTTHKNTLGYGKSKVSSAKSGLGENGLKGNNAYVNTILDFDNIWTVVENGYPELRIFAEKVLDAPKQLNRNITADEKIWFTFSAGTKEDPYVLEDARDLLGFANLSQSNTFEGKYVVLANDIAVNNDNAVVTNRLTWVPIGGKDSNSAFKGNFDGCGHTISGLYYASVDVENAGFFKCIANGANSSVEIKNFTLDNVNITAFKQVGAVAGVIYGGTYQGIKLTDTVSVKGTRVIGGLAGRVLPIGVVAIEECCFEGKVEATATSGGGYAGGLIGWLYRTSNPSHMYVNNCFVKGTIKNAHQYTGGVCGFVEKNHGITVENTLIVSEFSAGTYTAGVVGMNAGDKAETTGTIMNNVYTTHGNSLGYGKSKASNSKSGMAKTALQGDNAYVNTVLDFDNVWTVVKDNYPELRVFASQSTEAPKNINRAIVADTNTWLAMNAGTKEDPYILKDARDLLGLASLSQSNTYEGKYFVLANDIVVNNNNEVELNRLAWTPIGGTDSAKAFKGNFNGNGYTISGVYYNNAAENTKGLFARIGGAAVVENLQMENCFVKATDRVGALAGVVGGGTCRNIYVGDTVKVEATGTIGAGGIVGRVVPAAEVKFEQCWFQGTVEGSGGYVGGVVGRVYTTTLPCQKTTFENCLVQGTVKTAQNYSGGICGNIASANPVTIKDCLVASNVTGKEAVGGIIGKTEGTGDNNQTILNNVCTTSKSGIGAGSAKEGTANAGLDEAVLKGTNASATTGFDFENVWQTVTDSYPILRTFAQETNK